MKSLSMRLRQPPRYVDTLALRREWHVGFAIQCDRTALEFISPDFLLTSPLRVD